MNNSYIYIRLGRTLKYRVLIISNAQSMLRSMRCTQRERIRYLRDAKWIMAVLFYHCNWLTAPVSIAVCTVSAKSILPLNLF